VAIKHIYLDMDGVLVDFHHGFQQLCGIEEPIRGHEWPLTTTLQEHVGLDYAVCRQKSAEAPEAFWRTMEATPYGLLIAMACDQVARQNEAVLSILTDTSGSHLAALGKVGWLHDHMPIFAPHFCGTTKKPLFANPEALLIDDSHHVAEEFVKAGGRAIVLPQVWNQWRLAYGAPRTPKIHALLDLAFRMQACPDFFIFDSKSYREFDRG